VNERDRTIEILTKQRADWKSVYEQADRSRDKYTEENYFLREQVGRLKRLLIDLPYPDCACEYHVNLMKRIAAELKD